MLGTALSHEHLDNQPTVLVTSQKVTGVHMGNLLAALTSQNVCVIEKGLTQAYTESVSLMHSHQISYTLSLHRLMIDQLDTRWS